MMKTEIVHSRIRKTTETTVSQFIYGRGRSLQEFAMSTNIHCSRSGKADQAPIKHMLVLPDLA